MIELSLFGGKASCMRFALERLAEKQPEAKASISRIKRGSGFYASIEIQDESQASMIESALNNAIKLLESGKQFDQTKIYRAMLEELNNKRPA